ncbi:AAA family ATPase [Methylobacterium sp. CM6241]
MTNDRSRAAAAAVTLDACLSGLCPPPSRHDSPFRLLHLLLAVRCPRDQPRRRDVTRFGDDDRVLALWQAAYATAEDVRDKGWTDPYRAHTARVRLVCLLETSERLLQELEERLDLDASEVEDVLVFREEVEQLAGAAAGCLAECGDQAGHDYCRERAAWQCEHGLEGHRFASALVGLSGGLRCSWRPGSPGLGTLAAALQSGDATVHDAARAAAPETHSEATDDDRAGLHRLPPSVDPEPKPSPLTLVVCPRLDHLPKPGTHARDRGESPRALCDSVSEVALPLSPTPDPVAFAAGLRAAYPWASEVIERYATDLAGATYAAFRPRVLVGGAGCGKTSFALALLRAAGLPETLFSASGMMDGGSWAGTSRQWGTWRLSVPAQAILRARCASVGIVVDEVEKAGPSRRWGRLDETLLPFLERGTTARAIFDPAVEAPLDLSGVSYVITANDTAGLSGPLLDRAPVVHWPLPRREDLPVVAAAILDGIRREQGLDERWVPALDGSEMDALSAWRGGSLRPLRRMVEVVVASRDGFARRQPN